MIGPTIYFGLNTLHTNYFIKIYTLKYDFTNCFLQQAVHLNHAIQCSILSK